MESSTQTQTRRRVLLVDDHPIVRQGLAQLVNGEPDLTVCGEAEDVGQGLAACAAATPDVMVVDLSLKGTSGIDLIKEARKRWPGVPVLVLSIHAEALLAERVLRAGARGYIMKQEATTNVLTAIRQVLAGKVYLSEAMNSRMLQKLVQGDASAGTSPIELLTDREFEVFTMIGQGVPPRDIAAKLTLSIKTVEAHREHIKEKLKLKSGNELLRYAMQFAMEHS